MLHALTFLALNILAVPANTNPWDEVKNADGLRVWARDVPGSNIREVKAETDVAVAPERVWEVLADIEHYTEFMPYVLEARVLAPHETGHFEYQRIDPPLVDQRDYTLRVTRTANPALGEWRHSWVPANDRGPAAKNGVVRVTIAEGYWQLNRIDATHTKVTYWLYTDPGGSIPAFVANKANTTSVPDLLGAVKHRALNPAWRRND